MIIPENFTKIPNEHNGLKLKNQFRVKKINGELAGISAYYSSGDQIRKILYFDFEGYMWLPRINIAFEKIPFYGSQTLNKRLLNVPVIIVETEAEAACLNKLGICAVASVNDEMSLHQTDWSSLSNIKEIYLIPHNEPSGENYMESVYLEIESISNPPSVKVLRLAGTPPNGSLIDWLNFNFKTLYVDAIKNRCNKSKMLLKNVTRRVPDNR